MDTRLRLASPGATFGAGVIDTIDRSGRIGRTDFSPARNFETSAPSGAAPAVRCARTVPMAHRVGNDPASTRYAPGSGPATTRWPHGMRPVRWRPGTAATGTRAWVP